MEAYLDHNTSTPLHPKAKSAMVEAIEIFGGSLSIHQVGRQMYYLLEQCREEIASLLDASYEEINFVSGASQANNYIVKGTFLEWSLPKKKPPPHFIISAIEHSSLLNCLPLLKKLGVQISIIPVNQQGIIDLNQLENQINKNTRLISVMYANGETGVIQPIEEVIRLAKSKEIPVHIDAAQAIGKIDLSINQLGADYLSISGHKVYGPKGVGLLYQKKGKEIPPLIHKEQQKNQHWIGTENHYGIIGLKEALKVIRTDKNEFLPKIKGLRDCLEKSILETIPNCSINGDRDKRICNTTNISFASLDSEAIALELDAKGIYVRSSALSSIGQYNPSHVLLAMGKNVEEAKSAISFSLGRENNQSQIDQLLSLLPLIVYNLRKKT